jgi:glycosyltransferase involved in cell wall biosynthesis
MSRPIISWAENRYQPWTPLWILQESVLCLKEKRLPKRGLIRKKVFPWWYYQLQLRSVLTRKIKVGFGPVVEGEYTIGVRKSRIDPIVGCINRASENYSAGIFFDPEEMRQFDVVVIVKEFNAQYYPIIRELKQRKGMVIFDIVDNPFCTDPKSQSYHEHPEFLQLVDGIIASNPVQIEDVKDFNRQVVLIEHPVINTAYSVYPDKTSVDIIWQGYFVNAPWMFRLHNVLERVRRDSHVNVRMLYHANCEPKAEGMFTYIKWNLRDWQQVLAQADIGIVIKPQGDEIQRRKPSNKVISYMAAGLPVVCTPTAADKLIIAHGQTGYFADTDDEWYTYLKQLVEDPQLRKNMGMAGREFVLQHFQVEKIADKYIAFFDRLRSTRRS